MDAASTVALIATGLSELAELSREAVVEAVRAKARPIPILVFRRLLDMIDDEKLHWGSLRFQLQPKLLLDGRQERWAVGIWLIRGRQVCRTRREFVRTGIPRQVDVVLSTETSTIQHHPLGESRKVGSQLRYGYLQAVHAPNPGEHAETAAWRWRRRHARLPGWWLWTAIALGFVQFSNFGYH
jgi:hypothetical protein